MPLESNVNGIQDLNPAWPVGTDFKNEGDDHIRNVKAAVQGSWPNMLGGNTVDAQIIMRGANMLAQRIVSVGDPQADQDAVTLAYLNAVLAAQFQASYGSFTFGGAINWAGSGGWDVTPLSGDHYRLVFDDPAPATTSQVLIAQVESLGGGEASIDYWDDRRVDIHTRSSSGGSISWPISFVRIINGS